MKTALIAIAVTAPLAHAAVSSKASTALEVAAFGLVALWMLKLAVIGRRSESSGTTKIIVPLAAVTALVGSQLVPLPARVITAISPMTSNVYSRTLPGWPSSTPYREAFASMPAGSGEVESTNYLENWRTLALAPSLTRAALMKGVGYVAVFLLVLLYPFSARTAEASEPEFHRSILFGALLSGFVTSFVAIVQWSVQTGTSSDADRMLRVGGPFVNPDHFACFLCMILPVAVASTIFDPFVASERWSAPLRIFSGTTAFVALAALLLTGSRSGWIGAVMGLTALLLLKKPSTKEQSAASFWRARSIVAAGLGSLVLIAFLGGRGQQTVEERLREAATDATLVGRIGVWKDTLPMVKDFPLVGVGLGCWSELFPHYESPPWPADSYWGETHNDYLEVLTEIGVVGFAILAWLLVIAFWDLVDGIRDRRRGNVPVATIFAVTIAVAVEEFFDFGLQVPANALMFALLIALGLRVVRWLQESEKKDRSKTRKRARLGPAAGFSAAIGLAVISIASSANSLPYYPKTASEARTLVLQRPADVDAHMSLLEQIGPRMTRQHFRAEVERMLWLAPTNPYAGDLLALVLLKENDRPGALAEITNSMLFSPALSTHSFLFVDEAHLAALPSDERQAIDGGLSEAVRRDYQDSVDALGDFYNAIGEPARAVAAYDTAAEKERDPLRKSTMLIEAGISASKASDLSSAQADFEKAIQVTPDRTVPYEQLTMVLLRRKHARSARKVIDAAVRRNLDPSSLYMLLAQGEMDLGDLPSAEIIATRALNDRPRDAQVLNLLGIIYLAQHKYTKAASLFRRLCEITPNSGDAFFFLGAAEEGDYNYFAAEKDFQRAVALAPNRVDYKDRYNEFEATLAQNRPKGDLVPEQSTSSPLQEMPRKSNGN